MNLAASSRGSSKDSQKNQITVSRLFRSGCRSYPLKEVHMSQSQLDKDRRKVLKMALTSVAVVPVSSLLLNRQAGAGDLPPVAEDDQEK
jgi:hypothetical protein